MTKINEIINRLKQPKMILILGLCLLIVILFYLTSGTKKEAPMPPPSPSTLPSLTPIKKPIVEKESVQVYQQGNYNFTGITPDLPQELPVIKITKKDSLEVAQNFADNLELETLEIPEAKKEFKYWRGSNIILVSNQEIGEINLDQEIAENIFVEGEIPTFESAQNASKRFLESNGISLEEFTLNLQETEYLIGRGGELKNVSNPETANVIKLYYQKKLLSYPVFNEYRYFNPLQVWIGPNNIVLKIKYVPSFSRSEQTEQYPLITINQALSKLSQGEGQLIYVRAKDQLGIEYSNKIQSANLTQVRLVYFYSNQLNVLTPSFVFKGEALMEDERKGDMAILVPALPSEYLQPVKDSGFSAE